MIGQRRRQDWPLAIDAAPLGEMMFPTGVDNVVLGDASKPEVKRHRRIAEISVEPATGLEEHFLDDIAGVNASSDGGIEAQVDHAAHLVAVVGQKLLGDLFVAAAGLVEQL